MTLLLVILFISGYILIALEHQTGISKSAIATPSRNTIMDLSSHILTMKLLTTSEIPPRFYFTCSGHDNRGMD